VQIRHTDITIIIGIAKGQNPAIIIKERERIAIKIGRGIERENEISAMENEREIRRPPQSLLLIIISINENWKKANVNLNLSRINGMLYLV
jgi:hypothetical protein